MSEISMLSMIVGPIIVGVLLGAVPAVIGGVKGKLGLGLAGFGCCAAANFLLGLVLSIPVLAIFLFLLFNKKTPVPAAAESAVPIPVPETPPVSDSPQEPAPAAVSAAAEEPPVTDQSDETAPANGGAAPSTENEEK